MEEVYLVKKKTSRKYILLRNQFYYNRLLIIILFGNKQLDILWKKTFSTIYQLSIVSWDIFKEWTIEILRVKVLCNVLELTLGFI